jgi:hypothetical protein
MNDKPRIIAGLAVCLILALFPIWYGFASGGATGRPDLEYPDRTDQTLFASEADYHCVEDVGYIRASHMELLNQWRNAVVRDGERYYTSRDYGDRYEMSLTGTCMRCHQNREAFCARCHEYADVKSYHRLDAFAENQPPQYGVFCWDCHLPMQGN